MLLSRLDLALVLFAAAVLGSTACSGGNNVPSSGGSPSTSLTTTSPGSTPPDAPAGTEVASTVRLMDALTGASTVLYESTVTAAFGAEFLGEAIVVRAGDQVLRFGLDGAKLPQQSNGGRCREVGSAAEFNGRQYVGVRCGNISPNQHWMTYPMDAGERTLPSGSVVPMWDQWVVDIQSGKTRLLQTGLVHCGHCEARYGPQWSPSSRYVAYAEYGGAERRFLSDVQTGATRQIGHGSELADAPLWAPAGDVLVYGSPPPGIARYEDLTAGVSRDLSIAWPVAFDTSGTLLYSPAWTYHPDGRPVATTIVEAATGEELATLSGAATVAFHYPGGSALARRVDGFVATLRESIGCAGTAVFVPGIANPQCVSDAAEARLSPNGALIAIAREVGKTGSVHGPAFEAASSTKYEIDIVVVGGKTRTVLTGLTSNAPPLMVWNAAGTHLLVLWPVSPGL